MQFWARAVEQLPWFRKWDHVFEWQPPTFRWFSGAQTNLAYNAIDRHVERGWGGHTALIYFNERGERRLYTYAMLLHEVKRVAAALRGLGIQRGDRLTIYMPTCPEAIILMLATVRIGAIHSVVFAGFGAGALADRIKASGSRLVFTADKTFRKGKDVPLKGLVDAAIGLGCDDVEHVITLWRDGLEAPPQAGRDLGWDAFLAQGQGQDGGYVALESNEPAFILATSGTTAQTQAGRPQARRLPGAYPQHGQLGVWPARDRRLVVDIRHRLDRRALLHRLRAAAARLHHDRLRGRDRPPQPRADLAGDRGVRRHRRVHLAHGRAPADALWRRARPQLRPLLARTGLLRRRDAQRARLAVAPAGGAGRPHPGDRPYVADRDQRPDLRQPLWPGPAADQAWLGWPAAARHRGGHPDARRPAGARLARRAL